MLKISAREWYFLPGICWGGIWMAEFFAYPELWFFACSAAAVGIGLLAAQVCPAKFRKTVQFAAILLLSLLPRGDVRSALLPLVFGFTGEVILNADSSQWRFSRRFCGGFMLGAVSGAFAVGLPFEAGILFCAAVRFDGLLRQLAAVMLAAVCAACVGGKAWFVPVKAPAVRFTPGAAMSALGQVESKTKPQVVIYGGGRFAVVPIFYELTPAADVVYVESIASRRNPADMIVVLNMPEISDGGIRACVGKLRDNGVLVIPAEACGALPHWQWFLLPGSDGKYAAAAKNRTLTWEPDALDARLSKYFASAPGAPLPGALAGMLSTEKIEKPQLLPWRGGSRWFLAAGAVAVVILPLGYFFLQRKKIPGSDGFLLMLNCGGFAMLSALVLPVLLEKFNFPGLIQLLTALGVIWFIRRPVPGREASGRIAGVLSLAALALGWYGNEFFLLLALLSGGYSFAVLDRQLRDVCRCQVEPLRFFAVAWALAAVWLLLLWQIPWQYMLAGVVLIRFYSWSRN